MLNVGLQHRDCVEVSLEVALSRRQCQAQILIIFSGRMFSKLEFPKRILHFSLDLAFVVLSI